MLKYVRQIVFIIIISIPLTFLYRALTPRATFVTITATGEKNEISHSSEVWIKRVKADGVSLNLGLRPSKGWGIKNFTELFSREGEITFNLAKYHNLFISFLAHPWSGIVEITTPAGTRRYDLYRSESEAGQLDVEIPFTAQENREYPFVSDYMLVLAVICVFAFTWIKLKRGRFVNIIFGLALGTLLVASPYTNWDVPSMFLLVLFTCFAAHKIIPLFENGNWKNYAPAGAKRVILALIVSYATFASTYNQIVMETVSWYFTRATFVFIITWLLFWILAAFAFMRGFEYIGRRFVKNPSAGPCGITHGIVFSKPKITPLWFRIFGIIFLGYSFWLIAYFPANMSPDSFNQYRQVIGLYGYHNAHPIIHTLLIKICVLFVQSPFAPILAQTVMQCAVWATAGVYLHKQGLSKKIVYAAAVLVGVNPINGVYTVTLWKDVAFAIAVLALCLSLAGFAASNDKISKTQKCFLLVALFFAGTLRHNGIIILAVSAFLLSAFYLKKNERLLPLIPLALIIILNSAVYPHFKLAGGLANNYLLAYPISSVYYHDGVIDSKDRALLEEKAPRDLWVKDYSPFSINYFANATAATTNAFGYIELSKLFKIYLKILFNNPTIILKHHLAISDIAWTLNQSTDPFCYTYLYCNTMESNELGITQTKNIFSSLADAILLGLRANTLVFIFIRGGVYNILLLLLGYYALIRKRFMINIVSVPVLCNTLSLFVVNVAQDYRYTYAAMLTFPFIFLFYLASLKPVEGEH